MKHYLLVLAALFLVSAIPAAEKSEFAVLLENYYRFLLNKEVVGQANALSDAAAEGDQKEIEDALAVRRNSVNNRIRDELNSALGQDARKLFESFVGEYTVAENRGDQTFLSELADLIGMDPAPRDYPAIRRAFMEENLAFEVQAASFFLSDVQTWLHMKKREKAMPPLYIWLARNEQTAPGQAQPRNPLMMAEAPLPEFQEEEEELFNPLDAFGQMREEKRRRALAEAHAGMQQVAAERDAAEKEFAAAQSVAAQAEAEAMKAHAQKLAAVEKTAMEQRQNSWGNRIKRIIGGTVSAATGAFSGGLGTEAGQRAAEEIFR